MPLTVNGTRTVSPATGVATTIGARVADGVVDGVVGSELVVPDTSVVGLDVALGVEVGPPLPCAAGGGRGRKGRKPKAHRGVMRRCHRDDDPVRKAHGQCLEVPRIASPATRSSMQRRFAINGYALALTGPRARIRCSLQ